MDSLGTNDSPNYRHRSVRLPGYDYTQPGAYFITICTAGRRSIFGEIVPEKPFFTPSPIGNVAIECWESIPVHFPEIMLDEFVLMPNHLHGILQINRSRGSWKACPGLTENVEDFGKPVRGSIPTIVRSFKSIVSRRVTDEWLGSGQPVWQRNYYEHVIRTECDLDVIRKYIAENPMKWSQDPENPAVIGLAIPS